MITNLNFKHFKKSCLHRSHQTLFKSFNCNNYKKIENIFQFLLSEKDSFIFESVEKGKIKGRFTIIGLNPDKKWDIYNKKIVEIGTSNKKKVIRKDPLKFINELISKFNFKMPAALPSMSSMLVGYFSYDTIRYMENLPDNSTDDLLIPDVRLMRPKNLIIYDNLKKKIHFIENVFGDRKINNFTEEFDNINKSFNYFLNCG